MRSAGKPAGLVISAVEVNPCIRAPPRIPIVHAGPALGLQGISTGFPELKPNTGAGAGGASHEVQVQVQTSTGSTQEQVLRNDIAGTIRAQVQVQVQMTGKCSIAARAAPSKQELKTSHPGPLTRNRMAAIAVDVRTGECTGPRVTPPRGSREMVKPEASSTIPTIGRMQVDNQNSDSSTLKGVHQTTKRALENRGGLVNRKESVNTGRSEINKRSETIRRLVNRFRLVNKRRSVNTMSGEMTLCDSHSLNSVDSFLCEPRKRMLIWFKYQEGFRQRTKYRPSASEIIIIIVVFTITPTCLRNLCHLFPHSQPTQPW